MRNVVYHQDKYKFFRACQHSIIVDNGRLLLWSSHIEYDGWVFELPALLWSRSARAVR
jgi:hypothetical protein